MSSLNSSNQILRCPIHGSIEISGDEFAIIQNPFFQRLRYISQLGFAHFVFPGATHTRFSHSLGCMHLAGLLFRRLEKNGNPPLRELLKKEEIRYFRRIFRFAALLHDLGHMPFSHTYDEHFVPVESLRFPLLIEPIKNRKATHEDYSIGIILQMGKDPNVPFSLSEAHDICALIGGETETGAFSEKGAEIIFPILKNLISSEIDVDRMDYLLRDSYFTGVSYGNFDLNHLLRSLYAHLDENTGSARLMLDNNAITTYENFILARSHMIIQVYLHKTLQGFEFIFRQALKEKEIDFSVDGNLDSFLRATEYTWFEQIAKNSEKKWCSAIASRKPLKMIFRSIQPDSDEKESCKEIHEFLKQEKLDPILIRTEFSYSNQPGLKKEDPQAILIPENFLGTAKTGLIAEKSHLLKSLPQNLEILSLFVANQDPASVFSTLARFQEENPTRLL